MLFRSAPAFFSPLLLPLLYSRTKANCPMHPMKPLLTAYASISTWLSALQDVWGPTIWHIGVSATAYKEICEQSCSWNPGRLQPQRSIAKAKEVSMGVTSPHAAYLSRLPAHCRDPFSQFCLTFGMCPCSCPCFLIIDEMAARCRQHLCHGQTCLLLEYAIS